MGYYKFIKTRGKEGRNSGFFVPHLHRLDFSWRELKIFGFQFVKDRINGWTIWWVKDQNDYIQALKCLRELKKTRIFDYTIK